MSWCLTAKISRLCAENLGNSQLLSTIFALIQKISTRHPSDPELVRGSYLIQDKIAPFVVGYKLF